MRHVSIQRILYSVLLGTLIAPLSLHAHGAGQYFETVVDGYFIDIGYSSLEDPHVGESVRFDFLLFDAESGESVPFSDIWVRISLERKTVFAGGIARARFGTTGMTMVFPEEGVYELSVRYHNSEETLVETSFELPVVSGSDGGGAESDAFARLGLAVIGIVVGAAGAMLFLRRR